MFNVSLAMERLQFMSLDITHRNQLLSLARQSIDRGLAEMRWVAMPPLDLPAALSEARGSFVTLRIHKQLRGCCGNLAANRSISEDVWRNAWASAFADPRFSPLEPEEWPDAHLHISVLSPLESITVQSEQELIETLRPNVDGLVLERDDSRATFLPDVWEQISDPTEFVRHLKQKAGWPANAWSDRIKVQRYTTESFGEQTDVREEFIEVSTRRA
jgi:AmmeMemoRadiSam system protein A